MKLWGRKLNANNIYRFGSKALGHAIHFGKKVSHGLSQGLHVGGTVLSAASLVAPQLAPIAAAVPKIANALDAVSTFKKGVDQATTKGNQLRELFDNRRAQLGAV